MIANGINDLWLAGFENTGGLFNFVLSNQMKTNQRDDAFKLVTYMMPENTHKKTKKVRIYCSGIANVCGFKFFDKN